MHLERQHKSSISLSIDLYNIQRIDCAIVNSPTKERIESQKYLKDRKDRIHPDTFYLYYDEFKQLY